MDTTDIAIIKGLEKKKNDKCIRVEVAPDGKIFHFEHTKSVFVPKGAQGS